MMTNSRSHSRIISKIMYFLKLSIDQNSIVINYKFNGDFKSHIIIKGTREWLLTLISVWRIEGGNSRFEANNLLGAIYDTHKFLSWVAATSTGRKQHSHIPFILKILFEAMEWINTWITLFCWSLIWFL
jgi:hypothetical protein